MPCWAAPTVAFSPTPMHNVPKFSPASTSAIFFNLLERIRSCPRIKFSSSTIDGTAFLADPVNSNLAFAQQR